MHRTLIASLAVGLALTSLGCVRPRYYYDQDEGRWRRARWERHERHHRGHAREHDRHHRDDRYGGRLDLNRASARDLDNLPGLTGRDARRIVANRPYDDKRALVERQILGPRKYDQIEDYVYAGRLRYRDDDRRWHGDRDWDDDDRYRPYYGDDRRYQERRFFDDR